MLTIFMSLRRMSIQIFCPFFNQNTCFIIIASYELFLYFGILTPIRNMICKYFLQGDSEIHSRLKTIGLNGMGESRKRVE